MAEGLLESFGQGLQSAGEVLSPQVYEKNAIERRDALVNVARGLEIKKAQRSLAADQKFQDTVQGKMQPGMSSSAMLDAVSGVDPAILSESPAAQHFLQLTSQVHAREAAIEDKKEKIQFRYDQLELQADTARQRSEDTRLGIQERAAADKRHEALQRELRSLRDQGGTPAGYRKSADGNLEFIPGGPADPKTKEGKLGNRESVFLSRVMTSANEAAKDLENVVKLPMTASTGVFGGRQQGTGLFDATKEILANKMTGQEAQSYNVRSAGFQRSLAAIEASGLAPSGTLSHQMDAVLFKEGDTNFTKLEKLAQTRQIVEAGLETAMSNPRVPEQQLQHMEKVLEQIKKSVPFTIGDLDKLREEQRINPKATLGSVLKAMKEKEEAPKAEAPKPADAPLKNSKGWGLQKDAKGNRAYVGPNGEIEEVK